MNRSRNRKIAYLLSIVVLFSLMIFVGRFLERLQVEQGIAQKSLGEVNPASATFQLVLSGFRGVAVTFLWWQAQDLQTRKQHFKIEPCVKSITLLSPHFQKPWEFQAWNLAYNIASEWEGVSDKYYWIKRGINYQKDAVKANANQADLESYVGHMYFNRIGASDEKKYFRELFRNDPDLEFVQAASGIKDNFEKAFDWNTRANETCFRIHRRPKRMAPHPFFCQPALARTNFADMMATEGTFGSPTSQAWERAFREWILFGRMGGTSRDNDLVFKLEYTEPEFAALTDEQKYWVNRYERVVKYRYWKERCRLEATPQVQEARQAIHEADEARTNGQFEKAIAAYEKGLPLWRQLMIEHETFRDDIAFKEKCQQMEDDYLRLLAHVGKPTPARRPFDDVVAPMRESLYDNLRDAAKDPEPPKAPSGDAPKEPEVSPKPSESGTAAPPKP